MTRFRLGRRALIRGLGGAAAALPALEITNPSTASAQGGAPPKRFVVMYAGVSTSTDASSERPLVPSATGAAYPLGSALAPLGSGETNYGAQGYGVQDEVSLVSGLRIPWADADGEEPPPGGRSPGFHYNTMGPQLSGVRGRAQRTGEPRGPTADQLVADALAGDTTHRSLSYRVQAARYVGSNSVNGGQISYRDSGSGLEAIEPTGSPRLAHRALFSGFVPPDPGAVDEANRVLRTRRSVLALARERTRGIIGRLGAADRQRLEQHFDELNALEQRLNMVPPVSTASCAMPEEPEDPAVGRAHDTQGNGNLQYVSSAGYSDEQLRGDVMVDLAHMALVCDLTRVAAIRLTHDQSFLNMLGPTGVMSDAHDTTHGGGGLEGVSDMLAWHVAFFARFVSKLRDSREVDGSSMLDHTAIILLFEGGKGYDPESARDDRAHSTDNMVALVGGRVGGLSPGRHIVSAGTHPANALISAMSSVGLAENLGEMSGRIPELFG